MAIEHLIVDRYEWVFSILQRQIVLLRCQFFSVFLATNVYPYKKIIGDDILGLIICQLLKYPLLNKWANIEYIVYFS